MTQPFIRTTRGIALACIAMASLTAFAAGVEHPIGVGDTSFTIHPGHGESVNRQNVVSQTQAAAADGTLKYTQQAVAVPQKASSGAKSRAEVQAEAVRAMQRGEIQFGQ